MLSWGWEPKEEACSLQICLGQPKSSCRKWCCQSLHWIPAALIGIVLPEALWRCAEADTQVSRHWVILHWGWFVPFNWITWECHSFHVPVEGRPYTALLSYPGGVSSLCAICLIAWWELSQWSVCYKWMGRHKRLMAGSGHFQLWLSGRRDFYVFD